jgi:hypothetical protein
VPQLRVSRRALDAPHPALGTCQSLSLLRTQQPLKAPMEMVAERVLWRYGHLGRYVSSSGHKTLSSTAGNPAWAHTDLHPPVRSP